MSNTIRDVEKEDIFDLLHFCKRFYKKSGFNSTGSFNSEKTLNFLANQLSQPTSLLKVVENDGDLVGFSCFSITENPFSDTLIAHEIFFWVENNNAFTAKKLIKEYLAWAKSKGCVAARFGSVTSIGDTKFNLFLERLGFNKVETSFLKEI